MKNEKGVYLVLDDLGKPESERTGVLVVLKSAKDTPAHRTEVKQLILSLQLEGRLSRKLFQHGIPEEAIMSKFAEPNADPNLSPVEQGGQQLWQLIQLKAAVEEAAEKAKPLLAIAEMAVEQNEQYTPEQREMALDSKNGKLITEVTSLYAKLQNFWNEANFDNMGLVLSIVRGDFEEPDVQDPEEIIGKSDKVNEKTAA